MALRSIDINQLSAKPPAPADPQQMQQHPNVVIISVEAAIGTGKSSLLRMLQRRTRESTDGDTNTANDLSSANKWKWVFVQEPVEMWQDVRRFNSRAAAAAAESSPSTSPLSEKGPKDQAQPAAAGAGAASAVVDDAAEFNLLGKFYNSPPEFAFKLQSWAVLSRIETVARTLEEISRDFTEKGDRRPVLLVLERSWHSDRSTFATMHRDSGNMRPHEWVLYDQIYHFAAQNSPTIDGHVYLECSADTCMARLKKRDRSEETGVSADYQRSLIRRHEEWLDGCSLDTVLRLNVDEEFLSDQSRANWIFDEICTFAKSFFDAKATAAAIAETAVNSSSSTSACGVKNAPVAAPTAIVINGSKIRVA
jgi:deoxyadenosine/deoxycytidine kinase